MAGLDDFRPDEMVTVKMFSEGVVAYTERRWWERLLRLRGQEIEIDLESEGLVLVVITSEETGRERCILRHEDPEAVAEIFDELERIDKLAMNAVWN